MKVFKTPRHKKKNVRRVILLIFFASILLGGVYYFQFYNYGYIMSVPYRPNYSKINENLYVDKSIKLQQEEVLEVIDTAKQRVKDFFGEVKSSPIIILSNSKTLRDGGEAKSSPVGEKVYLSIVLEHFGVDIVAHEMTHAEGNLRTGLGRGVPVWFSEGLALQNDYRERHSEETWRVKTNNGKNVRALSDMATSKQFYDKDFEIQIFNYTCANHEVAMWIEKHDKTALLELLDGLNQGKKFAELYF